MIHAILHKYSKSLSLFSMMLLLIASSYIIPENPDSAIFRSGSLSLILTLSCSFPIYQALNRHSLRQLAYGAVFAFILSVSLGIGSELHVYEKLLPGFGSTLRRIAVPILATPALGALCSYVFTYSNHFSPAKRNIHWLILFFIISVCYTLVLLAFYPGIINYDFPSEYHQYVTGIYDAKHPVFHTILSGTLYTIGQTLLGTQTAGAAVYSIAQILLLSAMYATVLDFIQRRVPSLVTMILLALTCLLPFHGILAISTIKDALFTGLCALLCIDLWRIAENREAFLSSIRHPIRFVLICLLMALLRHNGIFAFLPACISLLVLCRSRRRAIILSIFSLLLCLTMPRLLEHLVNAQKSPSSEMMSIPCQQLMRTAEYGDVSNEEYKEINTWFANITYRYRAHYADTSKGNLDMERYNAKPRDFWDMYFKYAKRYPSIYIQAFLENCAGIWYLDDVSHAHTMDSEEWDFVYLKTGNIFPEELNDINAHSYLPKLRNILFRFTHHSVHEQYPFLSLLMRPSFYVYILILLTMYLFYSRNRRLALTLSPIFGIAFSLLFSACILVRYGYPIMTTVTFMGALILFADHPQKKRQ